MNDEARAATRIAQLEMEVRALRDRLTSGGITPDDVRAELMLLYENGPFGLCVLDPELRYVRISCALARMNGIPAADHLGKTMHAIAPELAAAAEPLLREVLATGKAVTGIELHNWRAPTQEEARYWHAQFWPLRDQSGMVHAISAIIEERTERRGLAEAYRRELEFRTLAENSPDVIVRYERNLRRSYINHAGEKVFGRPRTEIIGRLNRELGISRNIAEQWDEHLRQVFATGEERVMEFWLPIAGVRRFLQSRLIPERNQDGEVESILGITRDLTRNRETEEALRASELQFRRVVELVPDILYRSELPSQRATFVSPAIERILGFTAAEWEAAPELWRRQLHDDDRERVLTELKSAAAREEHVVLHYRLWHKDGRKLVWLEDRIRFERDREGRAVALFGAVTDVSERMHSETALRQREQEFRALAERSLDVVARHDRDLRFMYINPAVEGISGHPPSFYLRKSLYDLRLPASATAMWVEHLSRVIATGEDARFTYQAGGDGHVRYFDARLVPEFGAEGRVESVISVTREITRLQQVEERLRQTVKELETTNRRLQSLTRTDSLTGLANRRYLFAYIEEEWRRESRYQRPISMIVADIDYFKAYNDHYGHLAGDDCLRRVAEALRSQVHRPGDLLARYGGEEFVVVLPETHVEGACEIAEAMRRAVAALRIEHGYSAAQPYVTISLGVAALSPQGRRTDDLFMMADAALYKAKHRGRDNVAGCDPNQAQD